MSITACLSAEKVHQACYALIVLFISGAWERCDLLFLWHTMIPS